VRGIPAPELPGPAADPSPGAPAGPAPPAGPGREAAALAFVAEMYGVQLDQLAVVLGVSSQRAAAIAARWIARRLAQADRLSPGPRWVWLTKSGLASCGLPYAASPPALPRLAHIRAVVAVRLAFEAAPGFAAAGAHWRSERRLRARLGGRLGLRDHLPDAEVHWPEIPAALAADPPLPDGRRAGAGATGAGHPVPDDLLPGRPVPWAGECWAIEAELTPKTVRRTSAIMTELLARTGDYGCPAAEVRVPGRPLRHARVIYLCSPAAARTAGRAREELAAAGAARVEIRSLPEAAYLRGPGRPGGRPGRS
jgi:hypothetical protein